MREVATTAKRIRAVLGGLILVVAGSTLAVSTPSQAAITPKTPPPKPKPKPKKMCTSRFTLTDWAADSPGCFVDTPEREASATVTYPCDGGGFSFTLGHITFAARLREGVMTASASTRYEFEPYDDCTWESHQGISGPIGGPMVFSYRENPASGEKKCASPCTATGPVEVD